MKHIRFARIALIVCLLSSTIAFTRAQAQSDDNPPSATPIPLSPSELSKTSQPQKAAAITWIPDSGTLTVSGGSVSVRASSPNGLNAGVKQFALFSPTSGTTAWADATTSTFSSGNLNLTMTVTIPAGDYTRITFRVQEATAASPTESVQYTLSGSSPPPSGSNKLWLPLVFREAYASVLPLNLVPLDGSNNDPCTAIDPLSPGPVYTNRMEDAVDWYGAVVPGTSNATLNVSLFNFSGGQLQVFVPTSGCSVNATPNANSQGEANPTLFLNNIPPGKVFFRVVMNGLTPPAVPFNYQIQYKVNDLIGTFEDNDNTCQATPTQPGLTYSTFIDDNYDFFSMVVPVQSTVQINVKKFNRASQLQLRKANASCNPADANDRIAYSFIVNDQATIVQSLAPGTYYARMGPLDASNPPNNQLYDFTWNYDSTGSSIWAFDGETCSAFENCFGNATGGKFTFYWRGAVGATNVKLSFTTSAVLRCPAGSPVPGDLTFTTSTTTGTREVTGIPRGYYKLKVQATGPSGQTFSDELPLKMDCDFALTAVEKDYPNLFATPAP